MSGPLLWFEPVGEWQCGRCPAIIDTRNPAAWLPEGDDGEIVCVDCGDQIEAALPPDPDSFGAAS